MENLVLIGIILSKTFHRVGRMWLLILTPAKKLRGKIIIRFLILMTTCILLISKILHLAMEKAKAIAKIQAVVRQIIPDAHGILKIVFAQEQVVARVMAIRGAVNLLRFTQVAEGHMSCKKIGI